MLLAINAVAVVAALIGGSFLLNENLLSRRSISHALALRSGILLSVAFIELFPAVIARQSLVAGWAALFAFVLFFFVETFSLVDACVDYVENCAVHPLGWEGLITVAGFSFAEGIVLTVALGTGTLAGVAVGGALILHKATDGFAIASLSRQEGSSDRRGFFGLAITVIATPLGSLLASLNPFTSHSSASAILLGFTAGVLLYTGAINSLLRLHKTDDRANLAYFGAGVAIMAMIQGVGGG